MRSFCIFIGALLLGLLLGAAIAYPAWLLVGTVADFPFHKVTRRLASVCGLAACFLVLRYLKVDRAALGYNLPPATFARQAVVAFLIGITMMLPLVLTLLGLDVREIKAQLDAEHSLWFGVIAAAVLSGVTVGLIEETFFRGALQAAITRESGLALGIALPSVLYASVHFLGGKLKIPADQASWSSGFAVLGDLFARYTEPLAFIDSFLALLAVGLLLAFVRLRTRSLAACIGLHAGWVTTIAVLRTATTLNATSEHSWLVGSYDGVIGWAALGWMGLMGAMYFVLAKRPAPGA